MPDTYPPKFIEAFKRIFPKCLDLHELLNRNDMSKAAQGRIGNQMSSLRLYTLPNEEIVKLFKKGQGAKVLAFAKEQVKTAKAVRTLYGLWQPPPSPKS